MKKYRLISPEGTLVETDNMAQFSRENGLAQGAMCLLYKGKLQHHHKWRRYEEGDAIEPYKGREYTLRSPSGEKVIINSLNRLAREQGLNVGNLSSLCAGRCKSTQGWTLWKDAE